MFRRARPATTSVAILVWVTCAGGGPAHAAPIEDYLNRPVAVVTVQQEGRPVVDEMLLELVQTRVGEPLLMADVRETIAHLYGLGRFQDVRVDAARAETGVALTYELVPLHAVERIVFRGNRGLSEGRLRDTVVDRFGTSPPIGRAAEIARVLQDLYLDHGYVNASVAVRPEVEHDPDRTTLVLEVDAGRRALVRTVEIEGDPLMPRAQLIDRLGLEAGRPWERPDLLANIEDVVDSYRGRGHYEARIDHRASFSEDGTAVDVALTIEPGPFVSVVFEGDHIPAGSRSDLVPVRREGSVDEDLLEDSKRRIEAFLHDDGYHDALVEVTRTGDDREQRVVFSTVRGPRYVIRNIEIAGNSAMAIDDVRSLLQLEEGHPFVQARLDAGAGRVAEQYHRRGFVGVNVETGFAPHAAGAQDERDVAVSVRIAEGVRTVVGAVAFSGNQALPDDALRKALSLRTGEPYYAPRLAADLDALALQYLNLGYQNATADGEVAFSDDRSRADIRFTITEGPQVFVDHILIVGNRRTRAETIERELALRPGQPLSFGDIVESQRRLSALGLFRRVRITELRHPGSETRRDLLVTVEEAPLTTIGYGGGLEGGRRLRRVEDQEGAVEVFEVAPRGFVEVGRRNLWGKNRSINLFMRASFRPSDSLTGTDDDVLVPETRYGFNEYRILGTFREPKVLGTAADALVTGYLEQAIRSSFNFSRRGVRAEVGRRVTESLSVAGRYAFDRTRLFDERINPSDRPDIDRLFPEVRLSSFSTSFIRDTRDDALDPASGELVGVDAELAARRIGSDVGFAKSFLQGFVYRRIPGTQRIVFAGGARLGLATGFEREVVRTDENDDPILDEQGQPIVDVVRDIPASERFFAGGDTTVRGFALDRLGRPDTFDSDGFPKGGHALLIFNSEVRVPVWRDLGVVGFLDAGNVFALVDDLDLTRMRGGAGFGLRYRSPIGPLRVDLGFKLNRIQFANGQFERRTALHISLGQAF